MTHITQQLLAALKALRSELRHFRDGAEARDQRKEREREERETERDLQPPPPPVIVNVQNQIPNTDERQQTRRHNQQLGALWAQVIVTFLAFLAAAIYAAIASGQLDQLQKSTIAAEQAARASQDSAIIAANTLKEVRAGKEDTDKLIKAATDQAKFTNTLGAQVKRSADTAQAAMFLDERAWMYLESLSIHTNSKKLEVGQPFYVKRVIRNRGRTPAVNVETISETVIIPVKKSIFSEPSFYTYPPKDTLPIGVVASGDGRDADLVVTNYLTQQVYDRIMDDGIQIFVYGKIRYCDIFGKRHWTTWCSHFVSGGQWAICKAGNDIDKQTEVEECPAK